MNCQDQKNTKLMVQIYISTVWQNDPFFILCFIHKGNRANAKIIPLTLSGRINTSEKRAKLNFSWVYILILIANIIYGEKKKGCITNRENKVFYKGFSRQMPLKSSLYFFLLVFSFTICSILPTKDSKSPTYPQKMHCCSNQTPLIAFKHQLRFPSALLWILGC